MTRIGAALDIRFWKNTLGGAGSGWVNMHTGHVPRAYHETVIRKAKENRTISLDEIAAAFDEHLALGKSSLDHSSGFVKELNNCMSDCNGHCSTYVFDMKTSLDFVSSEEQPDGWNQNTRGYPW
ncbi:MAG: hypothetical protein HF976_14760 [ANME-2 cluster archaeon]|nr:hypothetical protein [ANME-2 cluster archaeon]MBC2702636.1 hypothetical protein [ANME-2 cluster archaeon]MBC2707686.1 hypothetical protein [ANME-2 cluster archaeon]